MNSKIQKMKKRVFLICVFVVLIIVSVLLYSNVRVSTNVMQEQIYEASLKSLENIRDDFEEQTKLIKGYLSLIYDNEEFVEDMSSELDYESIHSKYSSIAKSMALNNFPTDRHVVAMYVYDKNHKRISYYRHADSPQYHYPTDIYTETEDSSYNSDLVKDYVDSDRSEMLISSYYNTARQVNIIRYVYKIYVDNRGKCVGYIVCDMDSSVFEKKISSYTYYDDQIVYIQPLGDRVAINVGSPKTQQSRLLDRISEDISGMSFNANKKVVVTSKSANKVFLVSYARYGLEFYSMLPENMIKENQKSMSRRLLIISAIILITTACIIYVLSGYFSNQYAIMQKNTEYKALQAQINPHFLYNTLDTMSGMARSKKCYDISDMCMALSGMFRYSMGMKEEVVSLQKEVAHIRNYIYVMTTRKHDEIHCQIDIPGQYMTVKLPKISLQPVVENAINHGLNETHGQKNLRIYAEEIQGKVHIIVEDNGPGMDATELNAALSRDQSNGSFESESIGLKNINARIKYLYGKDYGIYVDSKPGEGCAVHIILKIEDGE